MALYDLVSFRQSLTNNQIVEPSLQELEKIRNYAEVTKTQFPNLSPEHHQYLDSVIAQYDQLIANVKQTNELLKSHLNIINNQINQITHQLFHNNYELETRWGSVDQVRVNRYMSISPDIEQDVKQRILLHTDWRYPALEIGCRDGEWTQYMVAADPLYIMDRHNEFLASATSRFTSDIYQRRLRKYQLVNDDLSKLPEGQMAFVFSWGYFNYLSIDTMRQYLVQILNIMRPGGIFMFSYNDGDTTYGAGMAENFAQTYMPKSMLVPLCESIGYEINKESDYNNNISWIEIKKPGKLKTVKAHQVLGNIEHI